MTAPAASTVRFGLLVTAVLATGTFAFLVMYLLVPGRADRLSHRLDTCQAALEADPAYGAELVTEADVARRDAAAGRWRACLRPVFTEQLAAIGSGTAILGVVAGGLYLATPSWMLRRGRLRRLAGAVPHPMVAYLDGLSGEMGLARPPEWLLAPHRRTAGGQVFGLPGRRRVLLDAGLVVRYATDRPAFRAVVLHELAHLRNRDVDRTYLTMSVWRAFVAVVVLPFLVLWLHPGLLSRPLRWHPPHLATAWVSPGVLVAFAVVTGVVYLTRNAVLRVRETEADATAHAVDGPAGALPAVLARLPAPPATTLVRRWRSRLGTHPGPDRRLAALHGRGGALAGGLWELAGTGLAAGVAVVPLVVLGTFAGLWPVLGAAVAALVVGPPAMLMLVLACWRAGAPGPARPSLAGRPPAGRWLGGPAVLTAGLVAGALLAASGLARGSQPPGSWLIAGIVLVAATVPVAAWAASAARGTAAHPEPRSRRTLLAVSVTAVLAGTVVLTVWLPFSLLPYGFATVWGQRPAGGAVPGWYERLALVTGAAPRPLRLLVLHPLLLPALAGLALAPALPGPRGEVGRVRLRRAVVPALLGAVGAVAGLVALPLALRATLPAVVRRDPPDGDSGAPFYTVLDNGTVLVGSLATAVVVAVVVARRGPYRPALAALAALLTALLATAAMFLVAVPVQCAVNVWEVRPPPSDCLPAQRPATIAWYLHWTLAQGLVLAVPLGAVAAAAGALARRGRPPREAPDGEAPDGETPAVPRGWRLATWFTAVLLLLLVVTLAWLVWAVLPAAREGWLAPQFR